MTCISNPKLKPSTKDQCGKLGKLVSLLEQLEQGAAVSTDLMELSAESYNVESYNVESLIAPLISALWLCSLIIDEI